MLSFFIEIARFVVFIERLWAALVVPFIFISGLLATAAWGVWQPIPFGLHILLLGLSGIAILAAIVQSFRHWPAYPSVQEGRTIIERRQRLEHRPVTLVADNPAQELDTETAILWEKAQHQASSIAKKAGAVRVQTQKIRADNWALRYPLLIVLVLALWADFGEDFYDLRTTLIPTDKSLSSHVVQGVDVWVQPPSYTQQANFMAKGESIKAPYGSTIKVLVHVVEPLSSAPKISFSEMSSLILKGKSYQAEIVVKENNTLEVRHRGRPLFVSDITVIADTPPTIALGTDLTRTPEGMLNIPFTATDDYGLAKVEVLLERDGRTVRKEFVLPRKGDRDVDDSGFVDFTSDPFAGLVVNFSLQAEDVAEQKTATIPRKLQMPERPFYHPVAKELVRLRRELFVNPDIWVSISQQLEGLMRKPEDFKSNSRAYLSMTFAQQTMLGQQQDFVDRSMGLMWDAALHIEKGPLAIQMERLLNAQRDLQKALSEGASPEKLDGLFKQLSQAMQDLLRQVSFSGEQTEAMMDVPGLQNSDLANMMEKINELLQSGAYEQAQEMLKELENLMAHVSMGENPELEKFKEAFKKMAEVAEQQKELIEESFNNPIPGRMSPEQRMKQQMLAEKLGEQAKTLKDMGFDTQNFDEAARAMGGAFHLSKQAGLESLVYQMQNKALELLQQGQQQVSQQLRQQMGYSGLAGMRRDPSGKLHSMAGDKVEMPDKAPETLSRKIRDTLFDRADDIGRSDDEQRYLQRLLKAF